MKIYLSTEIVATFLSFISVILSIHVKMKLAILSALLITFIIELCRAYTCIFHDSEGNKLSDLNASNWTECGQACAADPSCKFYSFWNKNLTIPGWHHQIMGLKKNKYKFISSKKFFNFNCKNLKIIIFIAYSSTY